MTTTGGERSDATNPSEPAAALAPLKVMTETTPTRFFNDSCAQSELDYAVARSATGATTIVTVLPSIPPHSTGRDLRARSGHSTSPPSGSFGRRCWLRLTDTWGTGRNSLEATSC